MIFKTQKYTSTLTLFVLIGVSGLLSDAIGAPAKTDVPDFFQVYSYDGRQSLKAKCSPKTADVITCNFILVEFLPPKRPEETDISPEAQAKRDPKFAEEMRNNPKKVREQWTKEIDKTRKEFCAPSSKERIAFETKMHDPQIGPKRKKFFQQVLEACSAKDPQVYADSMTSMEKRTCRLMVLAFSLDFKRIGKGQGFSDRGGPQGLCNIVGTYVLKQEGGHDVLWTLSETITAADTTSPSCKDAVQEKDINKPIVWSWKNYTEFELFSCDFIEPTYVQPQYPVP